MLPYPILKGQIMTDKVWYKSKTVWVNGLTLIGLVFGLFGIDVGLDDKVKGEIAAGVIAGVNLVLRIMTSSGISLTGDK